MFVLPRTSISLFNDGATAEKWCGGTVCNPCEECEAYFPSCRTPWCPYGCKKKLCRDTNAECQVVNGETKCVRKLNRQSLTENSVINTPTNQTQTGESQTQLIPRSVLYLAPDRTQVQLSPDGQFLAFVAPLHGIPNIWLQYVDEAVRGLATEIPITFQRAAPGIRGFSWTYMPGILVYTQDNKGDENHRLYKVNGLTRQTSILAGAKGAKVTIIDMHHRFPDVMYIGINNRDKRHFDIHKLNITSGEASLYLHNAEGFVSFLFDQKLHLRLASKPSPHGGTDYFRHEFNAKHGRSTWKLYRHVAFEEEFTTKPLRFDLTNTMLYWADSTNTDKANLILRHFENQSIVSTIYSPQKSDFGPVMWHPTLHTPLAVTEDYTTPRWIVLDDTVRLDFRTLSKLDSDSHPLIKGASLDFSKWLIMQIHDNQPQKFYLYDQVQQKLNFLFGVNKALAKFKLARMHPIEIRTRDGLTEVCYLSLPPHTDPSGSGRPNKPGPMVLMVHGGPWKRDLWGFTQDTQHLVNRGYSVLQCNFRSSTGYGKRFINAGNGEWGRKMNRDLVDAVRWAVKQKIADPKLVAIYGGSYGGYAVLAGLAFSPNVFACGVDIVGPSNLITLLKAIPPIWRPYYETMKKRIGGDPETRKGRRFLRRRSPLFYANRIWKPLLIAQGSNDPRVKKRESDQIFAALSRHGVPVTYLLFPDEGHGFTNGQNKDIHK